MSIPLPRRPVFLLCLLLSLHARGQAIDGLLASPDLWRTQRSDFVEQHRGLGFYWLSNSRDRAETHSKGLTLFSQPIYEVDAEFKGEKLSGVTVSIYNRGDAGDIVFDQWKTLMMNSVQGLNALTKSRMIVRNQEASDAVKAYAITWQTPVSNFLLEYSRTREVKWQNIPFRAEFIRLQVTPDEKPKSLLEQAFASSAPQPAFDGPSHVRRDASGDVRIDTVPMVDQGQKGYCVVAAAERVMRYYGIPVDEHELAELANSSATEGTSIDAMLDSLKKLSQRLRIKIRSVGNATLTAQQVLDLIADYNRRASRGNRAPQIPDQGMMLDIDRIYSSMRPDILKESRTHNPADVTRFQQEVRDHIDQGIPILWSVILGIVPEAMAPKGVGGHMRLIIGYNSATNEILYTDSWGPGHELKRMAASDAWTITTSMNAIEPLEGE